MSMTTVSHKNSDRPFKCPAQDLTQGLRWEEQSLSLFSRTVDDGYARPCRVAVKVALNELKLSYHNGYK